MATPRKVVTLHKWKIDNFDQRISAIEHFGSISSDVFLLNGKSKAKFMMKLERNDENFCNFYLVRTDSGRNQSMQLNVSIWYENAGGQKLTTYEKSMAFTQSSNIKFYDPFWVPEMKKLATDDALFICCKMNIKEPSSILNESDTEDDLAVDSKIGQDLFALHSSGHSDLIIQVGGKEFKAFKCMLMSCSSVFQRMFSCPNSTEAKTGILKIENTKPEVIDALIRWVYKVQVDNIDEIAIDLYKTADKYDIVPLKEKCMKRMIKDLSDENLLPSLIMAYTYKDEKFKNHILNFLHEDNKNLKAFMASDGWMELCAKDPEQTKKILDDIYD